MASKQRALGYHDTWLLVILIQSNFDKSRFDTSRVVKIKIVEEAVG